VIKYSLHTISYDLTSNSLFYSDDENVYPSRITKKTSISRKKVFDEKWTFVSETADCRPTRLPDFLESSGPTFTVPSNPAPSDFYNKVLPDSLFNHIVKCTNVRAKLYFTNVHTDDSSWNEVG